MSYLRLHHMVEYFSNTVVFMPQRRALAYLYELDYNDYYDEEDDSDKMSLSLRGRVCRGGSYDEIDEDYRSDDYTYDDLVPEVVQPWLPRTQYLDGVAGQPAFLSLNTPQHYKRSADSERYKLSDLMGEGSLHISRPWEYKLIQAKVPSQWMAQLEKYGACTLSPELAIKKYEGALTLCYLDTMIGRVNDNLGVSVHPKYGRHFAYLLHKTGVSLC
jgi:hypothetical protein